MNASKWIPLGLIGLRFGLGMWNVNILLKIRSSLCGEQTRRHSSSDEGVFSKNGLLMDRGRSFKQSLTLRLMHFRLLKIKIFCWGFKSKFPSRESQVEDSNTIRFGWYRGGLKLENEKIHYSDSAVDWASVAHWMSPKKVPVESAIERLYKLVNHLR